MNNEDSKKKLEQLIAELISLQSDVDGNRSRLIEICSEALLLVDKSVQPEKWAAFKFQFAQFSEEIDQEAALAAYKDACSVFESTQNIDFIADCRKCIGLLLVHSNSLSEEAREEAIANLEAALEEYPDVAVWLAVLYQFRLSGDPYNNWKKRLYYSELELKDASKEEDLERWARAQNELGVAKEEEPDANYFHAVKKRIEHHHNALTALKNGGKAYSRVAIRTMLYLSECYLAYPGEDEKEQLAFANQFSLDAHLACKPEHGPELLAEALLARVRVMLNDNNVEFSQERLEEALNFCGQAEAILDPTTQKALVGTVESFRANLYLNCLRGGDHSVTQKLLKHGENALLILKGEEHIRNRRIILQTLAEGLFLAKQYKRAGDFLQRAVAAAETSLSQAVSLEARMERIWELRDSSALLAWCLTYFEKTWEALLELERGKCRFWYSREQPVKKKDIEKLIPKGGALLFGNFSADPGVVIVVTEKQSKLVWLPSFGRQRLMELQRGGVDNPELGGWLRAYHFQNSRPDEWHQMIRDIGKHLYEELWCHLLPVLGELEIELGSELVWFDQGGSSVFPMHAAWTTCETNGTTRWLLEDYVVRYGPSAKALIPKNRDLNETAEMLLLIANPREDLPFSELEAAWIAKAAESSATSDPNVELLYGKNATPEAVLEAISKDNKLHFCGHAVFDLNHPLDSSLLLAADTKLRLRDVMTYLEKSHVDSVMLSACETGINRVTSTPDESLGFAAPFLHSGSNTVLSTLWPVDDRAAALLISQYYREQYVSRLSPSKALRAAQLWLKSVTAKELRQRVKELREERGEVGIQAAKFSQELRKLPKGSKPFKEPYFWAGFIISGRE